MAFLKDMSNLIIWDLYPSINAPVNKDDNPIPFLPWSRTEPKTNFFKDIEGNARNMNAENKSLNLAFPQTVTLEHMGNDITSQKQSSLEPL